MVPEDAASVQDPHSDRSEPSSLVVAAESSAAALPPERRSDLVEDTPGDLEHWATLVSDLGARPGQHPASP